MDTSDALYHRLHRYPEVLEKRASRLERERLIHERSKLINELEDLRGRGWVYTGNSSAMGGRAEVERQRKLKEGEERLARYATYYSPALGSSRKLTAKVRIGMMRYYRINPENRTSSTCPLIHFPPPRPSQPRHLYQIYMLLVEQTPLLLLLLLYLIQRLLTI